MNCPLCFHKIHLEAESCPHCGQDAANLDSLYSRFNKKIELFHDGAGIFKASDRAAIEKQMKLFNSSFPDCFITIHTVNLINEETSASYATWALNCPEYQNFITGASSDSGVAIIIDVNKKQICLAFGYQLECYFQEKEVFRILAASHPNLIHNEYRAAIKRIVKKVRFKLFLKSIFAMRVLNKSNLSDKINY